jgi:hypothetical protein
MNARYRRALGQTAMLVTPSAIACDRPSKTCQVFLTFEPNSFWNAGRVLPVTSPLIVTYTPNEPRHRHTITYDGGCDSAQPILADLRACLLQTARTSGALHAAANWLTGTIPDGDGRVQSMPDKVPSQFVGAR